MDSQNEAFRSMYKRYLPVLKIIASKKLPADEVEDAVQDVFLSYFVHYSSEKPEHEIGPLLVKMIYNRCADYNRKRLRHPITYYDPAWLWEDDCPIDDQYDRDGLSVLLEKQEYKHVLDILDVMKEDWSQIFLLYVIEERPMSEVSRILGISEGACRTRLSRGRQFLKNYLETHKNLELEAELPKPKKAKRAKSKNAKRVDLSEAAKIPGST